MNNRKYKKTNNLQPWFKMTPMIVKVLTISLKS